MSSDNGGDDKTRCLQFVDRQLHVGIKHRREGGAPGGGPQGRPEPLVGTRSQDLSQVVVHACGTRQGDMQGQPWLGQERGRQLGAKQAQCNPCMLACENRPDTQAWSVLHIIFASKWLSCKETQRQPPKAICLCPQPKSNKAHVTLPPKKPTRKTHQSHKGARLPSSSAPPNPPNPNLLPSNNTQNPT